MSRVFRKLCTLAARIGGKSGPASWRCVLLLLIAIPWLGWPRPGVSEAGTVILVGDVLRFNQRDVWSRIVEYAPDPVIVAAASDRPKLYGGFARRALERHGAFADLLPVAIDPAEFGVAHRHAASDPALVEKVREAAGVFFVGGAPQRLAEVLFQATAHRPRWLPPSPRSMRRAARSSGASRGPPDSSPGSTLWRRLRKDVSRPGGSIGDSG